MAIDPTTGAAATTINPGDTLDGGAGRDTLNITSTATNNNSLEGLKVSNIEVVNITGANFLGAASPALAAAEANKATTAAALAAAQSNLADAIGRAGAAERVHDDLTSEFAVVAASTATVASAATAAAAAKQFATLIKPQLDAYIASLPSASNAAIASAAQALATRIDLLATSTTAADFGAIPATGATFGVEDVRAVAASVRTAQDGTSLTVPILAAGASDADVVAAAVALADRNTLVSDAIAAVNTLTQSTLTTDLVADQEAAAAAHVAGLANGAAVAALAALTGAALTAEFTAINTSAFTEAQLSAAAKAAATSFSGAAVAEADQLTRAIEIAAEKLAVANVNVDFSLAQLNSAAVAATRDATGASLLTVGDDTAAITARALALKNSTADEVTAGTTAVTTALAADNTAAAAVTVALANAGSTSIAATQFADAEVITLLGSSGKANVTGVAAGQTIGFDGVTGMDNTVAFGATVTAGSLASKASSGTLTVTGAGLTSLSLEGAGTAAAGLTLVNANPSSTVLSKLAALNVDTTGATTLNTTGMAALTSVTQSGAGSVTLNETGTASKLATVTTGAGADNVRITTATAADNPATTIDETVNAVVSTGAGNDRVVVATTGTGTTTVDLGDGNDTLILTSISSGANSISGGAGNDTFIVGAISTLGTTKIDGGSGTDVLSTSQSSFNVAAYTILTANVSNVETLRIRGNSASIDASKVAMSQIEFLGTGTNTVTEVSSSQQIVAARTPVSAASFGQAAVTTAVVPTNVTATAAGYKAATVVNGAITVPTVFGDNLNISLNQTAAGTTVAAKGSILDLSVAALAQSGTTGATSGNVTGISTGATVTGDVLAINATLDSARGSGTFGLGVENMAGLTLAVTESAGGTLGNLANMTSVTVSGAGVVSINAGQIGADKAQLTVIDLSGMTAFADLNALGQEVSAAGVAGGFTNLSTSTVTLNDNVAETVILGGARDTVITGSTVEAMDTIVGFTVVAQAANPLLADATRSDVLDLGVPGGTAFIGGTGGNAAAMVVTGDTFEAALLQAASLKAADGTNIQNVVFHFGGDTYVFQDRGPEGLDDTDYLVRLTGELDLGLLLTSSVIIG